MASKLDPTLVPPSKKTVDFFYQGLLAFYPESILGPKEGKKQGIASSWGSYKKSEFLQLLWTTTKTEDTEISAKIVLGWKKAIEKGTPLEETIPAELDQMLSQLDENVTGEKKLSLYEARQLAKGSLLVKKTVKEPAAAAAAVSEGLKIAISPATAKGITSFATKTLFAPISFVMDAGKARYYQENPATMSAMELGLFSAIDPKEIRSAIKRKTGLNPETKNRLENLAKSMERAKNSSRPLNFLAAKAYGGRTVQLFFDIQEVGIPQARTYNLAASGNTFVLPQSYFSPKGILGGIGQQLFGKLASKGLRALGKKVAEKAVATAAVKGAGLIAGTAIGGPIGAAISLAGSWILGKVKKILSKLPEILTGEKGRLRWAAIGSTFFGGIFLMQSGFVLVGGILTATGAAAGLGQMAMNAKGTVTGGANFIQSISFGLTNVALPAIGMPLVIALISVPILIAIIIFIINSGAYIVPPRPPRFTGIVESPHIGVEKTATPDCLNRSGCPDLPNSIAYSIKITAKKGSLTNIKFENSYQVLGEGSGSPFPDVPDLDTPETISPMEPYIFSYTLSFGEELDDSIIIDTLKVTADAPENPGAMASDVASVIIGDPPASSCPILGGAISTGSYDGTAEIGHGSNGYWGGPAGIPCNYSIPAFSGCKGPTSQVDPDQNNECFGQSLACNHYGFAADAPGHRGDPVFLPSMFGETLDWELERGPVSNQGGSWGYGYVYKSGKYSIYLGHLNQTTPPSSAPSGTIIGTLYRLTHPHVHIELQIDGQWVRPDFLCGGDGP